MIMSVCSRTKNKTGPRRVCPDHLERLHRIPTDKTSRLFWDSFLSHWTLQLPNVSSTGPSVAGIFLGYFLHGFVEHFEVFVLRFGANLLRWPSTWGPRRITKFMRCGRKIIKTTTGQMYETQAFSVKTIQVGQKQCLRRLGWAAKFFSVVTFTMAPTS